MSAKAEALVAQIGILPKPGEIMTIEHGRAALQMPDLWRAQIAAWLKQTKPKAFTLPIQHNFEWALKAMTGPLPPDLLSQVTDRGLAAECEALLGKARSFLRMQWPVRYLDRPGKQILLQPGQVELMAANSLLGVLDDPDRFIDEWRMETVTPDQITAFKGIFPELFKMALAIMWEEVDRVNLEDGYSMRWGTEMVIRRLVGLPPAMSIAKADRPQPAASTPNLNVKFDDLKTKAQKAAEI